MALADYTTTSHFSKAELAALVYADAMTLSAQDVTDKIFSDLKSHYTDDAIVELTGVIAWENASSKFNRALRIPSQDLWRRGSA